MRLAVWAVLLMMACNGGGDPKPKPDDPIPDTDADTDADADADTDADADSDSDADTDVGLMPNEAQGFCASGGVVSGGGISGHICTSPLDVAAQPASNGNLIWSPGPIGTIYE